MLRIFFVVAIAQALSTCINNNSDWSACGGIDEDYDRSVDSACDGIVQKVYVPLANVSADNAYRKELERRARSLLDSVPPWLSPSCFGHLREYVCTAIMVNPVKVQVSRAWVTVPSYPDRSICFNYISSCHDFLVNYADLIELQRSVDAAITQPYCNASLDGIDLWPVGNQTVLKLSNNSGSSYHDVQTASNDLSNMGQHEVSSYKPRCPLGFVVPDETENEDNWWVVGSGCVAACQSPLYTESEWLMLERAKSIIGSVALFCISALLVYSLVIQENGTKSVMISFSFIALIGELWGIVMISMPFKEKFCRNSAVGLGPKDGFSFCLVQSAVIIYVIMGLCFTWTVQAVVIYLRIVHKVKLSHRVMIFLFSCIFIVPLFSVFYAIGTDSVGYSPGDTFCFFTHEAVLEGYDIGCLTAPVMLLVLLNVYCMGCVVYKMSRAVVSRMIRNSSGKQLSPTSKATIIPSKGQNSSPTLSQHKEQVTTPTITPGRGQNASSPTASSTANDSPHRKLSVFFSMGSDRTNFNYSSETSSEKGDISNGEVSTSAVIKGFLDVLGVPIAFTLFFTILFSALLAYRLSVSMILRDIDDSLTEWSHCVFLNERVPRRCPAHPKYRVSIAAQICVILSICGTGVIIAFVNTPFLHIFSYFSGSYATVMRYICQVAPNSPPCTEFSPNSPAISQHRKTLEGGVEETEMGVPVPTLVLAKYGKRKSSSRGFSFVAVSYDSGCEESVRVGDDEDSDPTSPTASNPNMCVSDSGYHLVHAPTHPHPPMHKRALSGLELQSIVEEQAPLE